VLEAAQDALRGVGRFDVEALRPLADLARRAGPREAPLTEQERVVLRLMRQQLTYKEIAQRLGVSWHTVRTHAQSILRKSGVHSRRDLEAWDARMDEGPALAPAAR
jgi:DNA-binding NarL/FixJ family response regulator